MRVRVDEAFQEHAGGTATENQNASIVNHLQRADRSVQLPDGASSIAAR